MVKPSGILVCGPTLMECTSHEDLLASKELYSGKQETEEEISTAETDTL